MSVGIQRTLARVSWASATHTLAWADATTSGRASESRSAVARLIGRGRSLGWSGADPSFGPRPAPGHVWAASRPGRPAEAWAPAAAWAGVAPKAGGSWARECTGAAQQSEAARRRMNAQADRSIRHAPRHHGV